MPRRYYPLARTLLALILAALVFSVYRLWPHHAPQEDELVNADIFNSTAARLQLAQDIPFKPGNSISDSSLIDAHSGSEKLPPDSLPAKTQVIPNDEANSASQHDSNTHGFAYLFYATSNVYACSVLVNIHRLKHTLNAIWPIHVLVSPQVSATYVRALQNASATVHVQEPPKLHKASSLYYSGCLLKLLAFKMHRLDASLKRVLIFDADQLILKNLDHLFAGLPPSDLAAPRAYWIARDWISSTFMMITPSDRVWDSVSAAIDDLPMDKYDMDIVNDLFGTTVTMLGGEFITINSHWEAWDLPSWYHSATSTAFDSAAQMAPKDESNSDVSTFLQPAAEPIQNASRQALTLELYHLQEAASVLHFFAVGKPWTYTVEKVRAKSPHAHPLLAEQFAMWHQIAGDRCPKRIIRNVTIYA